MARYVACVKCVTIDGDGSPREVMAAVRVSIPGDTPPEDYCIWVEEGLLPGWECLGCTPEDSWWGELDSAIAENTPSGDVPDRFGVYDHQVNGSR